MAFALSLLSSSTSWYAYEGEGTRFVAAVVVEKRGVECLLTMMEIGGLYRWFLLIADESSAKRVSLRPSCCCGSSDGVGSNTRGVDWVDSVGGGSAEKEKKSCKRRGIG